jgi:uncharacterized protein
MIAESLLRTRLSDDEIEELGDVLEHRCVPDGGMPLSMLDGLLTAIASCPEFIAPSEWLPLIWGADDDIVFESTQEVQRLTSLVLRRMNEITHGFDEGTVEPIFLKITDEDGEETVVADVWCAGYLRGMAVREEAWDLLVSPNNEAGDYLAPIFALALPLLASDDAEEADLDDHDDAEDDDVFRDVLSARELDELTELIPGAAYAIHQYWRDRQRLAQVTIRRTPQPGRNVACPCGSGRKYKKCCGKL